MIVRKLIEFYTPEEVTTVKEEDDPNLNPGDKFKCKASCAILAWAGLDVNQTYYTLIEIPKPAPPTQKVISIESQITNLKNCVHTVKEYLESIPGYSPSRDYALGSIIRASDILESLSTEIL